MNVENITERHRKKLFLDKNLLIVFSVTLTAILSVSSIAPALPKIQQALNISHQSVGMLIAAFTLPGVVLTPVLGVLADRYGRKRILVPSLMLFGAVGGMCAFIKNFELLLVMRLIQGMGGAALGSLNITIIGDLFFGNERTTALGYNSSILNIGTSVYPAVGGALAVLGWNYPFMLAFAGIPVSLLVLFVLKNPEPKNRQNLKEYLHNLLFSIKHRQVIVLFISCCITFVILYGPYLTYFPLLIAGKFGATSLVIGLVMSTMSAATAVTSWQLGRLASIFPERALLKISFLIYGAALTVFPLVNNLWFLLIPTVIYGVANGVNIPCAITLLSGLAPIEYRAAFMSTNGMVLRLGQTLGPMLMGVMFALGGINYAFFSGTALAVTMFIGLAIFLRE
ncbi:MFS transporter [bacterium SM23_31]|nr:MAG: MFS transporter [bacterium SM23_31]